MRLRDRTNMVQRTGESWRPPLFTAPRRDSAGLLDAVRRFFDLQAGSIWNDARQILPNVKGHLLDVGCGAQPLRPLVSSEAKYRGIDTIDAKANFGYEVPDTDYFAGAIWPVADKSIDFILCTETLEHVLDTRGFLAEAARCLRSGGDILMTVPFAARWHFIPHDYWRFTPSSVDYLLRESGFEDIRVFARGNAATVAMYKSMALVLKCLAPQHGSLGMVLALRLIGLALSPAFIVMALIANISLTGRGGDDCLGYTIMATKR